MGKKEESAEPAEVLDFAQLLETHFLDLYYSLDVASAPEKRKPSIIDSIWMDLYKEIFEPNRTQINNTNSRLLYNDVRQIEAVVDMYIKLCARYGGVIKYNSFCTLTGIDYTTICLWYNANNTDNYIFTLNDNDIDIESNSINYIYISNDSVIKNHNNIYRDNKSDILSKARFDVKKKLRKFMIDENTNGLSTDTMGHTIRANNDEDIGKLYDPKKIVLQTQAKAQALTMSDLKLLE